MFTNIENISYEDFKNICRTCSINNGTKYSQDNVILNIFYRLTDIPLETNDDLPQLICLKCFDKINEINEFAFQCKRTHDSLINCLKKFKENEIKEESGNIEETELVETKEFLKEEIKIIPDEVDEINSTNEYIIDKFIIKQETNEPINQTISETSENLNVESITPDSNKGSEENQCEICEKKFLNIKTLERHMKRHDNSRPYKCEACPRTFKRKSHMKKHMRGHTGECYHKCDHCPKTFKQFKTLEVHMRVHSGERPYKCSQCPKTFAWLKKLVIHALTHKNERRECERIVNRIKCEECPKSFAQMKDLERHFKMVHSGECLTDFCASSSGDFLPVCAEISPEMAQHEKLHLEEKPIKCEPCDEVFKTSDHLEQY